MVLYPERHTDPRIVHGPILQGDDDDGKKVSSKVAN